MSTLIYYGNYNLQNYRTTVSFDGSRNMIPTELQRLPIARGIGSVPVNTRFGEKMISISGTVKEHEIRLDDPGTIESFKMSMDYLKKALTVRDQYLHIVPTYDVIIEAGSATATFSNDAVAPVIGTLDTYDSQYFNGSIRFNIDVSASVDNFALAEIANVGFTMPTRDYLEKPRNIEFAVFLPSARYVTGICLRFGTDSSNYESRRIKTDYQGQPLSAGWNILSLGYSEVGADSEFVGSGASLTSINYLGVKIEYASLQNDMDDILVDGFIFTEEKDVVNYPCYVLNSTLEGNHYNNEFTKWTAELVNYTGYGFSTQGYLVYDNTAGGFSSGPVVDYMLPFKGSFKPLPSNKLTITGPTSGTYTKIRLLNLNNFQYFEVENPGSDPITFGDRLDYAPRQEGVPIDFNGQIIDYDLGQNHMQMIYETSLSVALNNTTENATANDYTGPPIPGNVVDMFAQSFTATATGRITTLQLKVKGNYKEGGYLVTVQSDSAGNPDGTVLSLGYIGANGISESTFEYLDVLGLNVAVTNGTTYWIVVTPYYEINSLIGNSIKQLYLRGNTTGPGYTGGVFKDGNPSTAWNTSSFLDACFKMTITPVDASGNIEHRVYSRINYA